MKILCNACEVAEAKVLCCADEAALCWACDQKIHAANKLASKHQRVPLSSSSSPMPKCDICQEMVGYFFCLQDRALLCRKCDVAVHTVNSYVSSHQRFVLTGVKVGLEATKPCISTSTKEMLTSVETVSESASSRPINKSPVGPFVGEIKQALPGKVDSVGTGVSGKLPLIQNANTSGSGSNLEEFLGFTDPNQNFGVLDRMSPKVYGRYCL
ncbi:B-box zinc finger protein 22-like [Pyrus communis]|uniref:B-box zinc finger protein 22-like n=1 Tax=Pyrus communis TaxID=23211 RepID=UPI0035C0B117